MRFLRGVLLAIVFLVPGGAFLPAAAANSTSIPGVTASIAYARQYGGVLRIGVAFRNDSDSVAKHSAALKFSEVALIDADGKRRHFGMRDAEKRFLAGPISDWNDGGRWFPQIAPRAEVVVWVMFEGVPADAKLSLEMPVAGTFSPLTMTAAPPAPARLASSQPPVGATLVSATREAGQLKVQVRLDNPERRAVAQGSALMYRDVYALDPVGKRRYPLLRGQTGLFLGEPRSDNNDGGRYFLGLVQPGSQVVLNLTFQPPPDAVKTVDIVVPHFPPFENVAITGMGGRSPRA